MEPGERNERSGQALRARLLLSVYAASHEVSSPHRPNSSYLPRSLGCAAAGYNAKAGGATRYVLPAFRNAGGGGGEGDVTAREQNAGTRSLGDVAGRHSGARRFIDAALFFLTKAITRDASTARETLKATARTPIAPTLTTTADTTAATESGEEAGERQRNSSVSGIFTSVSSSTRVKKEPFVSRTGGLIESACRAAGEQLGCTQCRPLPSEPRCGGITPTNGEEKRNFPSDQASEFCNSNDAWWGGLRQVPHARILAPKSAKEGASFGTEDERQNDREGRNVEAEAEAGQEQDGSRWVGLKLSLRSSDVGHVDGQAAIVDFLKSRIGEYQQIEDNGGCESSTSCGEPSSPATEASNVDIQDTLLHAGDADHTAQDGVTTHADESVGYLNPRDGCNAEYADGQSEGHRRNDPNNHGEAQERGIRGDPRRENEIPEMSSKCGTVVVVVDLAVFVFGRELSKRDRAELHRQAEAADGVVSSSHGVGEARFLTLTCGALAGQAVSTAQGVELSSEKAEMARRLFRLAQEQYHSRYESLSHGEIREVVALGGPTEKDHPDLFRLWEQLNSCGDAYRDDGGNDNVVGPPTSEENNKRGDNARHNTKEKKNTGSGVGDVAESAAELATAAPKRKSTPGDASRTSSSAPDLSDSVALPDVVLNGR